MEEQGTVQPVTAWKRATQRAPLRRAVAIQLPPQQQQAVPQNPPPLNNHQPPVPNGDSLNDDMDSLRKRAATSPQQQAQQVSPPASPVKRATSQKTIAPGTSDDAPIKLIEAIRTPATLEIFSSFLKQIHSQENLSFWTAVENYKKLTVPEALASRAKELVRLYLDDNAIEQVNLDGRLRTEILNKVLRGGEFDQNLFDAAQRSAFRNMEMDSFPKFLRSPAYQKFKEGRRSTLLALEGTELPPTPFSDATFFSSFKEGSYGKRTRAGDMLPRSLWIAEEDSTNCSACSDSFTHLRRRHHCRHCGMLYCNDCSSRRWAFPRTEKPRTKDIRKSQNITQPSALLRPDTALPVEGSVPTSKERVCHTCYALLEGLSTLQASSLSASSDEKALTATLLEVKPHLLTLTAYLLCPFPSRQLAALHTLARLDSYIKRGLVVEEIANGVLRFMGLGDVEGRTYKTPPPTPLGEALALEVLGSCVATSNRDVCRTILQGEIAKLLGRLPRMLSSTQANDDVTLSASRLLFNSVSCDAGVQVRQINDKNFVSELLDLISSCHNRFALGLLIGTLQRVLEDNDDYVETVLAKSAATRTLSDLLSLRHPMKTLLAALYGSKVWGLVAASKWSGHIYGEGNLLRNLMKITIAEGLDSDIVEAAATVLARLSFHEGREVLCSDKLFLGEFVTMLKHYSDGVKKQVACMLQHVCAHKEIATAVLDMQGYKLLQDIRTYDEELQRYVTEAILQLESHMS